MKFELPFFPWPQQSKSPKSKESNNHIIFTTTRLHIGNLWSNKWTIILGANEPPGRQPLTHLVSELAILSPNRVELESLMSLSPTGRSTEEFCNSVHSFIESIHQSFVSILTFGSTGGNYHSGKRKRERASLGSHHPTHAIDCGRVVPTLVGIYACGFMFTESMRRAIATMSSSKSWTRHWNWQPSIPILNDNVLCCHYWLLQCGWK
jgi:hypothetical protein